MTLALVFVAIVILSVVFHYVSPWQATPIASNWGSIDTTITITLVITALFFVVITLFMAYCVFKFRARDGHKADYEPENKKLEWWLISITTVGICGLLAPGLVVYGDFVDVPDNAREFEAVGEQWRWSFRLPGDDGKFGKSGIADIDFDNPFGLDRKDPAGQDDVLISSSEVHLEVGQPVKVLLRSKDVLHDFYVPEFRAKMDLIPGQITYFWFTPTKEGEYEILCAELCGVGHFNMRGKVVVESAAAYSSWLSSQPTFAETLTGGTAVGLVEQGKQLAQSRGCLACHSVDGSQSLGPGWLGLYGKIEILVDGSQVMADDEYLKESIVDPAAKLVQGYPGVMVAYEFSDEQLDALVAYMRALGESQLSEVDEGNGTTGEE